MATLRILVPEATTNYIKNPSARYDTTGWTSNLASISRSLDYARFGFASLKVATVGVTLYEGVYYRVNALSGTTSPVTVSVYLRGTGQVRIRLIDNPFGHEYASLPVTLRADHWTRVHVTGQATGSNDLRLYVETTEVRAATFYVDGAQMELKPYPTTFCDGDQEGCRWNIVAHNSHSIREGSTRAGGRWVTLAGEEREEKNLYMTVVGGMGLPPLTNNTQSYADAPGSYYQNTKVLARPLTFTFHAKHEDRTMRCTPQSLSYLHQLRQLLIDLVKPDKTRGGEEFTLEYTDGDVPLYLKARYDGGLEGDWDVRNGWITSFPLRLLAVSPYFYEDDQQVSALDFQEWDDVNNVISRVDGAWGNMNFGVNDVVQELVFGTRGEVIAAGGFTRANSDVSAIDPLIPANRIAWWDGEKWNLYGTGTNGYVNSVAVAPNGYVYAAGDFTSIGGVAANRVAYWDGSAWNAMGSGIDATGLVVAVAPNGDVYVGGTFNSAGGVVAKGIARWDGSSWHNLDTTGVIDAWVYSLAISPDGSAVYAGGFFFSGFSGTIHVAKFDTSSQAWEELGDDLNGLVRRLRLSPSGVLYAGGQFTASGSQTINRIGYWNGANWLPLGSGTDGEVFDFDVRANGELIVVGSFSTAGGLDATGVAVWNGTSWTSFDIAITDTIGWTIYAVLYDTDGNVYLSTSDAVHTAGVTTVENIGSAEVNPKLYVAGPATMRFIENQTNKKRVYLDLEVLDGEDVYFDFGRGKISSTIRGDLSYAVIPGSDMRAFTLLPGENRIAALMVDDVDAKLYMSYVPKHWSADATQTGEEL